MNSIESKQGEREQGKQTCPEMHDKSLTIGGIFGAMEGVLLCSVLFNCNLQWKLFIKNGT